MIGSQANTGRCLTKFIGQARSLELELLLLPLLLLMLHGMSVVRYTRWPVAHAQSAHWPLGVCFPMKQMCHRIWTTYGLYRGC